MIRPIKFRGKRIDNGEWIYGNLVTMHGRNTEWTTGIQVRFYGAIKYGSVEVDPKTVGQFTGLKDKNGKEIFEDDIVNLRKARGITIDYGFFEITGQVFYHNGSYYIGGQDVLLSSMKPLDVEIIGNIYENLELLAPNES